MAKRKDIAQFIRILREVDPRWMRERFTNGACYELHKLLIVAFHGGEPWVVKFEHDFLVRCHVYTRYGDEYFDILGPHRLSTIGKRAKEKYGRFAVMDDEDHRNAREMNFRRLWKEGAVAMAHECSDCLQQCDCDGDDTFIPTANCIHDCDPVDLDLDEEDEMRSEPEPCCPAFPDCDHPTPRGDRKAIEDALVAPLFPVKEGGNG